MNNERKEAIDDYFLEAKETFAHLSDLNANGKSIRDMLPQRKILNVFNMLRSILDYTWVDIVEYFVLPYTDRESESKLWAQIGKRRKKGNLPDLNFPYFYEDEQTFDGAEIIRKIKSTKEEVYNELKQLQPFKNRVLHFYVFYHNIFKHEILQQQKEAGKRLQEGEEINVDDDEFFYYFDEGDANVVLALQSGINGNPCIPVPGGVFINRGENIQVNYLDTTSIYISNSTHIRISNCKLKNLSCHNSTAYLSDNIINGLPQKLPIIIEYDIAYEHNVPEQRYEGIDHKTILSSANWVEIFKFNFKGTDREILDLIRQVIPRIEHLISIVYRNTK